MDFQKIKKPAIWIAGSFITGLFLFYLLFLNHVTVNELGIAYNSSSGTMTAQEHPGWYLTSPLTRVAYLDLKPMRVDITSTAKVINARIVVFQKNYWRDYVALQGFGYDLSTTQESTMLGYAFSGKEWPFLKITEELSQTTVSNGQ